MSSLPVRPTAQSSTVDAGGPLIPSPRHSFTPAVAYGPDPATGPPPQEWIHRASHRQRLELAFAILRHHGVRALSSYGDEQPLHPSRVDAVLGAGVPGPSRPCVLWSRADEVVCFAPDGRLRADLPLRSRGVLLDVLTLALAAVGLIGRPDPATGGYLVLHNIPF